MVDDVYGQLTGVEVAQQMAEVIELKRHLHKRRKAAGGKKAARKAS